MTNFFCSVCGNNKELTMVNGTVICLHCLDKAKRAEQQNLLQAVGDLVKENDIYD